jgi:hypothetical protein
MSIESAPGNKEVASVECRGAKREIVGGWRLEVRGPKRNAKFKVQNAKCKKKSEKWQVSSGE